MSTPTQPEQPFTPTSGPSTPQTPPPGAAQVPPYGTGTGVPLGSPQPGSPQPGSPQDWYAGQPGSPAPVATSGSAARLSIIFAAAIVVLIPVFLIVRIVVWNTMREQDVSAFGLALGVTSIVNTLLVLVFAVLALVFGMKAIRQNDRAVLGAIGVGAAGMAAISTLFALIPPFF